MFLPFSFRDLASPRWNRRPRKRVLAQPCKSSTRSKVRFFERLEHRLPFSVELVKDLYTVPDYLHRPEMVAVGDVVYFVASTEDAGSELWKSDGSQAGTVRVKDIHPGVIGSSPAMLANVGGTLYFQANDGEHGFELWKSDGTELGTVLVKDINPGPLSSSPTNFAEFNGSVYFAALVDSVGIELWKSDGTDAGTALVADINSGVSDSNPQSLTAAGNVLYFAASDGASGSELWKSDGTTEGTLQVHDIEPGPVSSTPRCLVSVDGNIFFLARDGAAKESLWMSDGTAGGTRIVLTPDVETRSAFGELTALNGSLVFRFATEAEGYELWRADGKTGEANLLSNIRPGKDPSTLFHLTVVNGLLYFAAVDELYSEVWRSDGTPEGTYKAIDHDSMGRHFGAFNLTNVNGTLYFVSYTLLISNDLDGFELYKSDGTIQGTELVDVVPRPRNEDNYPGPIVAANNRLFWSARDQDNGQTLWASDGTSDSVILLNSGSFQPASAEVNSLIDLGGTLIFKAAENPFRDELWRSDGSLAGTSTITNIDPTGLSRETPYIVIGNEVYFTEFPFSLMRSNGTAAGTYEAWDGFVRGQPVGIVGNLTYFKGQLYFTDGLGAIRTLTVANSSANATVSSPGYEPQHYADPVFSELTVVGDLLYYVKRRWSGQDELWRTDGTEKGTRMLRGFSSRSDTDLRPRHLVNVNGILYFQAYDEMHGSELWRSDGTQAGTRMVRDIAPGKSSSFPNHLQNVDGTLFFSAADSSHGTELWKTDGTERGTELVRDVFPGLNASAPQHLVNVRGQLYFIADDGVRGSELWTSDGSFDGTRLVKDVRVGPRGSAASKLTAIQGTVYFQADDGRTGAELWRSDGTGVGTELVADLAVPGDSNPKELVLVGDDLYFAATTPELGTELWTIKSLDGDSDGTANFIEDAAPNFGDGNHDGIPDSRQPGVVSIRQGESESFVTFVAPSNERFIDIRFSPNKQSPLPETMAFPAGVIQFSISTENDPSADSDKVRDIRVIFQDAGLINATYEFVESSGNPNGYWHRFLGDPENGVSIETDIDSIVLHLKDGQVGDSDGMANGVIEYRGAFAVDRRQARWQNPVMAGDANEDGLVSPIDALMIINELNRSESRELPAASPLDVTTYYDVSGDNFISAMDVLLIINELSRKLETVGGEGEGIYFGASFTSSSTIIPGQLLDLINPSRFDQSMPDIVDAPTSESSAMMRMNVHSMDDPNKHAFHIEPRPRLDSSWGEDVDWFSEELESAILALLVNTRR